MSSFLLPVHVLIVAAAVLAVSPSAASPGPADHRVATRVSVAGEEIEGVEVVPDDSTPTRFTLVVVRQMPTPGFSWHVDSVDVDSTQRRIVARVTEVPPEGMVAQVMTRTRFEVPIGSIDVGSYFVELWARRDTGREHRPANAWVLAAR